MDQEKEIKTTIFFFSARLEIKLYIGGGKAWGEEDDDDDEDEDGGGVEKEGGC